MSTDDFQTKYAAVMETMLQSAIAETTKIFESMVDELKAEISKVRKENEDLKLKCSQFEGSRSQSNFSSEDRRLLPGRRDRSGKRDTAVQCDLVASSTILTEQCQPLRMLPVYPRHHNMVAALQDHDYETHVEDSSQIAIIIAKQESALKQEEDESVVGSGQVLNDYTEMPLYPRHEESQMAVELSVLGMCSNSQGSPDQTSDPSTHSLATSMAAVNCYTGDYSKVSQKMSVAASHGKFMVPENHQLAVAQVTPVEKEQQAEGQTQSVLIPRNSHTDQQFSINMEKDTLEASSALARINTSPAESPHAPSVQPIECHNSPLQFTSSSQEPCFAMDPEITVHEVPRILSQINDDTSENGTPSKHTSSFPVTVTVHSQTFSSFNKSVGSPVAQKQSCKDSLSAVVRLTRLPFPLSEEESVLVSRLPASACCDCQSFLKPGPSKEKSSSSATSTRPLKMSQIYSSLEESPFAVPLNTSQVPAEQNCIEERSNICTENFVTLDNGPKNKYWEASAPSTSLSTVAFNRIEASPSESTCNSREEKISKALQDCAMTNDRSEEEIQSATLVKGDTSDPHVLMSKSQFLAQLAVSPVAQDPEKASSIDSVDAIASCAETGRSEKKRLQQHSPLAQLQSHIKKHLQARRAKTVPQMETQAVSFEMPRLENDQLIDETTILKLRGVEDITSLQTDDSIAINPTISVSCQKETVSESSHIGFSKSKAIIESASVRHQGLGSDGDGQDSLNMSSVSVSPRRPGLPTESATLKKTRNDSVGYRITRSNRNNSKPKNTPIGGSCPRNAAVLMSMKKSKFIQDVSMKHFEMVTANTNTVTKSKNPNPSKLQNRARRRPFGENEPCGKALKQCTSQAVWTPLDISRSQTTSTRIKKSVQLSVGKEAGSHDSQVVFTPSVSLKPIPVKAPPIVSPLQPLLVIGRRLLKNQCGECGQVLSSSAALESHVSLHAGHRPFSCSLCGKHFADSKSFKRHNRVHRNGRIHVCQQCGKGFVYRFCLTKHIQMVHSRIKPFVCQICNKGCFTKLDVEAHIRMHTGEKPFHCNLCDKKFKRRVNLNVHLRWHNGEKRHWCPYCGKGFLDFNNLKRHKYIHTGEKPHSCPHCPKHFTQSGHLKKHVKNVHKVK